MDWIESDGEWIGRAGWRILSNLALEDADLPDEFFEFYLGKIEAEIECRKNPVRDAMNSILIGIGARSPNLQN